MYSHLLLFVMFMNYSVWFMNQIPISHLKNMQIVVQGTNLSLFSFVLCAVTFLWEKIQAGQKEMNMEGLLEHELTCMFTRKVSIPLSAATYISKGSVEIIM